ncbi:hypothetical protein, partial [Xanthomonas nasturtii]|uniref:hypothetical protein n=1 Tax=Xanthomonas nasturtii TaxID=1843581 RepID=UPI0020137B0C
WQFQHAENAEQALQWMRSRVFQGRLLIFQQARFAPSENALRKAQPRIAKSRHCEQHTGRVNINAEHGPLPIVIAPILGF